ncbi:hypothetical protein ES703_33575 [subsurface metagenome]
MLAQIILTPTESKKLIAKAIAKLDVVRQAATEGMVLMHPSSSTYFIVEELTGAKPKTNYWVCGVVTPKGMCVEMAMVLGGYAPQSTTSNPGEFRAWWIIKNGKLSTEEKLSDLLNRVTAKDVFIKGVNASATSRGEPKWPRRICLLISCFHSSFNRCVISVSIKPGATALAVIPRDATSLAMVRVKPMMPALAKA